MPIIVGGAGGSGSGLATVNSKAWLRQQISRHIDERNIYIGQATGDGSTTTLVSSELTAFPDDHWINGEITFFSGTNAGLARRISGFAAATGTITHAALGAASATGDGYELRRKGPFADSINQTINEAILRVYNWFYVPLVDAASVAFSTDVEEYTIPSSFVLLSAVEYEKSGAGAGDWASFPNSWWSVVQGSAPKLRLSSDAMGRLSASQQLRLVGYRHPNLLSAETDQPEMNPNYVIAYAVAKLLGNFAGGASTDPDAHAQRQGFWTQLAENERLSIQTRIKPSTRRVKW